MPAVEDGSARYSPLALNLLARNRPFISVRNMDNTNENSHSRRQIAKLGLWQKLLRVAWMLLAAIGVAATVWLLLEPGEGKAKAVKAPVAAREIHPLRVSGPGEITLRSDSPMRSQLSFDKVETARVEFPIFSVTGSILARINPGSGPVEDRWQFATGELSTTYADWIRTKNDLEFAVRIETKAKQLSEAEIAFRKSVFDRLEPLGQSKVVPERDVPSAKADLLRAEIVGEREVFESQRVVLADRKELASLERTLRQSGLDPALFSNAEEHTVLISANVPESRIADVHVDQLCQVRLLGLPGQIFPAHVEAMAGSVTSERRMLRLVFHLVDPKNVMKPGMFGDVGLGTNPRDAMMISTKAIVHLGNEDYALVLKDQEKLEVREVKVGEPHADRYEILDGLKPGETIVGLNAVLLKPLVRDSLLAERAGGK